MTITRDVQIALAIYTAGVVRARREYALHPFAGSEAERTEARERMRVVRANRAKVRAA